MNLRSCAFKDPMILATALLRNGRKDARLIHLGEVGAGGGQGGDECSRQEVRGAIIGERGDRRQNSERRVAEVGNA